MPRITECPKLTKLLSVYVKDKVKQAVKSDELPQNF